jgi:hypothetical protein
MAVDMATLAIRVQQDGVSQAQAGLDSLTRSGTAAERQMGQVSSASSSAAAQMMKLAAAAMAAYSAYRLLSDVINIGMKLETMNVVMTQIGKNVGVSAQALKYFTEEVKSTGVTTTEAMSAISKAMVLGLNLNQMKEFATRVRDVAVGARDAEGRLLNTSQTLMRVMHGIESGQVEILRTMGVSVRGMDEVYKEYAVSIGKTRDQLNTAHKSQAMLNEFMRASVPLAGSAAAADETVGKQLASMARYSETAKEALWDLFKPGMEAGVMGITNAFKELKVWADANHTSLGALGLQVGTFVGRTISAGIETAKWAASNLELLRTLAEFYIISKAIAWVQGLYTAMVAAGTASTVFRGVIMGLIPTIAGAQAVTTTYSANAYGMATAMTAATVSGAALNAMMITLLPAVVAVSVALAGFGAYKTFTQPGPASTENPLLGAVPGASILAGPAAPPPFIGPPAPPAAELQMRNIMAEQQKAIQEANEAAARAMAKQVEGKGKGKGTEAAESAMASFIQSMNQEVAKGAGDTEAILNEWYGKQLLSIKKWEKAGLDTSGALAAADAAYYSKKDKLDSDFNDWYISGLGNSYEALVAAERKKFDEVAGNAEKTAKVQEVFDRKHYDLTQQMETERLSLFKGYYDAMASLSPTLEGQLDNKRQSLEIELKLAQAVLDRARWEGKITQDTYEQITALRAVEAQYKKFNLEMENNKGLSGWAWGRGKEADQRSSIKDMMGGLESGFQSAFSSGLQGVLAHDKNSLKKIGQTMWQGFLGEITKASIMRIFDSAAKMMRPGVSRGGDDPTKGLSHAADGLQRASAGFNLNTVQFGLAAGGLLLSGIGIMMNSQALVYAGMVLQVAGLAIQIYQALTATTQMMAASALVGAAGALTSAAFALMMAAVVDSIPFLHQGGLIYAHRGWPRLKSDEVPIIAQAGERVLTRSQNKTWESGGGGGNSFGDMYFNFPNVKNLDQDTIRRQVIPELKKEVKRFLNG